MTASAVLLMTIHGFKADKHLFYRMSHYPFVLYLIPVSSLLHICERGGKQILQTVASREILVQCRLERRLRRQTAKYDQRLLPMENNCYAVERY